MKFDFLIFFNCLFLFVWLENIVDCRGLLLIILLFNWFVKLFFENFCGEVICCCGCFRCCCGSGRDICCCGSILEVWGYGVGFCVIVIGIGFECEEVVDMLEDFEGFLLVIVLVFRDDRYVCKLCWVSCCCRKVCCWNIC